MELVRAIDTRRAGGSDTEMGDHRKREQRRRHVADVRASADQYREFANEARALAQRLRSDDARNKVLQIAEAWEKLATDDERQ